jgi:hypothetical protein
MGVVHSSSSALTKENNDNASQRGTSLPQSLFELPKLFCQAAF